MKLSMIALLCLSLAACGPTVSDALLTADPSAPPRTACTPGEQVCQGASPAVCNARGDRLWPALPVQSDGAPGVCAHGCVLDHPTATTTVAHCAAAAMDGGAR